MIIAKIADKIWQGYRDDMTDEERDELFRVGYWDEYAPPYSYDEVYLDVLSLYVSLILFAAFVVVSYLL